MNIARNNFVWPFAVEHDPKKTAQGSDDHVQFHVEFTTPKFAR